MTVEEAHDMAQRVIDDEKKRMEKNAEKRLPKLLNRTVRKIEKAAKKGEFSITITFRDVAEAQAVKSLLRKVGFYVVYDNWELRLPKLCVEWKEALKKEGIK